MCYLEPIVDIYEDGKEVKRLVRVTEADAEKIAEYAKTGDESVISSLLVSDEDKEKYKGRKQSVISSAQKPAVSKKQYNGNDDKNRLPAY